jgi:hypothetical protein
MKTMKFTADYWLKAFRKENNQHEKQLPANVPAVQPCFMLFIPSFCDLWKQGSKEGSTGNIAA